MEKRCVGTERVGQARKRQQGGKGKAVAERVGGDVEAENFQRKEKPLIVLMGFRRAHWSAGGLSRFVGRGRPLSSCPGCGASRVHVSSRQHTAKELGEREGAGCTPGN